MKLLLDFLPIVLFFGTFKYAEAHAQWAADFATRHFGFLVSGGTVGATEGPVLLATLMVIVATAAQIVFLLATRRRIDLMLWVSLGLVVVLGGATVWFHNETFIKWKPSVLYWAMALAFWISQAAFGRNLPQAVMGEQLDLPTALWRRLNTAWIVFFAALGVVNLYVAYNYSTDTWVTFKLFGIMGMIVLFVLAQSVYLSRHVKHGDDGAPAARKAP